MVSKLKGIFFPVKEKTFFCVKNRSYFIKEGLSFGPFPNLEVISDSLAGSPTLQEIGSVFITYRANP
jgi:hypothetical protein